MIDMYDAAIKLYNGDDLSFMIDYSETDHAKFIDYLKESFKLPFNNTQIHGLKKYVDLLSNNNVMYLWRLMASANTQNTANLHYKIKDRILTCVLQLDKKQKNEQRATG